MLRERAMKNQPYYRGLYLLLTMACLGILFSACLFFADKYNVTVTISPTGDYSFVFEGTIASLSAREAEAIPGKKPLNEETYKSMEEEMRKDPSFKEVRYLGKGRYQIRYERTGNAKTAFNFLDQDTLTFSILTTGPKTAVFRGMVIKPDELKFLQQIKMPVEGVIVVKTKGKVIQHNAQSTPSFFGLFGGYRWEIKSLADPTPQITIQLD